MKEAFITYLKDQTLENFLALRKEIVEHEEYEPYTRDVDDLEALYEEEEYEELLTIQKHLYPNFVLSPRVHFLKSLAYKKLKNEKAANAEMFIYVGCVNGIKLTGDGSKERPYFVSRISDERDMLLELNEHFKSQSLLKDKENNRIIDRLTMKSKKVIYFDITDCYKTIKKNRV